jgi:hypothetical protein
VVEEMRRYRIDKKPDPWGILDKKNIIPTNLISLCLGCHSKTNLCRRKHWEEHFNAIIQRRGLSS